MKIQYVDLSLFLATWHPSSSCYCPAPAWFVHPTVWFPFVQLPRGIPSSVECGQRILILNECGPTHPRPLARTAHDPLASSRMGPVACLKVTHDAKSNGYPGWIREGKRGLAWETMKGTLERYANWRKFLEMGYPR